MSGSGPRLFTVRLYGELAFKIDALAYRLWVERGRSGPLRYQEAFRHLATKGVEHESVNKHRCKVCEKVYGAPYCWEHGDTVEPV